MQVCQAKIKPPSGFFKKINSFVRVTVGETVFNTETIKNGGKNPRWGETFEYQVKVPKETIKVEVLDD